jgi:hypothetical protein
MVLLTTERLRALSKGTLSSQAWACLEVTQVEEVATVQGSLEGGLDKRSMTILKGDSLLLGCSCGHTDSGGKKEREEG